MPSADGGSPDAWTTKMEMTMKRSLLIILAVLLPLLNARAQYVTYNHDETKMYQVTVMETGVGSLTPRAYYSLVHNKYYQDAAETNKLRYRSEAAAHGTVQVGISEQIDTSLTKRAEVEALNMADRQVDLPCLAGRGAEDPVPPGGLQPQHREAHGGRRERR